MTGRKGFSFAGEKGKGGKVEKGGAHALSPFRLFAFSPAKLKPFRLLLILALALTFVVACSRGKEQTVDRAASAWDSGNYKLAAEEYENFLRQNTAGPQSLDARFKLANIYYFNLRRFEQARAHYAEFLSQDPANQ